MNEKYKLYAELVLAEHNRYYFMRNVHMEISIALEKANNLQKILINNINEEPASASRCLKIIQKYFFIFIIRIQ